MHLPPHKKGRGIVCKSGANKFSDRCQKIECIVAIKKWCDFFFDCIVVMAEMVS
jgi:hypothetical protein